MSRATPGVLVAGFAMLLSSLYLPADVAARATVGERELVSSRRVGRSEFLYTYQLTLNNDGPSLDNLNVWVSCVNPGTTMVDDIVEFGDIAADTMATSTGTFSFRQNRRQPFDPACLVYEIGFETPLIISGTATDMPLANALIVGTIIHPASGRPIVDSGRPIVDTFSTTADIDGSFTIEMEAVTQEDYVILTAEGVADQEGGDLTNQLGTVGALHDSGDDGSIIINPGNFGSDITHITTALAVLAERANGGPIRNDGELARASALVDGGELLIMASVIKAFIDNPGIQLPSGFTSTLDLVTDPQAFDSYVTFLETNFPVEFQTAIEETAVNVSTGYVPGEVPGEMFTAIGSLEPLQGGAFQFNFDPNGGGTATLFSFTTPITWTINVDGDLVVSLLNPLTTESFPTRPPFGQVRAVSFTDQIRIVRLVNGFVSDHVFVLRRNVTTFPDNPTLPTEVVETTPGPDEVFLAFRASGIVPITVGDIVGAPLATFYFHENNASLGLTGDGDLGADLLTFNADGSGVTQRRGFQFNWTLNADGSLTVLFDTGDSNRLVKYASEGVISHAIAVGATPNNPGRVWPTELIASDGVSQFTNQNLTNNRYRFLFRVLTPEAGSLDYLFLPGGSGCRIFGGFLPGQRIEWTSTPDNRMDLRRFIGSNIPRVARNWQAVSAEPGILGDRVWVIELADFSNFAQDPNHVFADPLVTPGRINAFEIVDNNLGSQLDPCGFATSLSTTFSSNNGGTGNMFDIVTNALDIDVTGFEINTSLPQGTAFTAEVFVLNGSYQDSITAPPGCVFNCAFDANVWSSAGTANAVSAGRDSPTFIDIADFLLAAQSSTGIWITLARDGTIVDEMRYTNGVQNFQDNNISIINGAGVVGPFPQVPELLAPDRTWNGTVFYNTR